MFGYWLNWLRQRFLLAGPVGRQPRRRGRSRLRRGPCLERLEDRTVLSTYQWTGAAGDSTWSTAGNWTLVSGSGTVPNAVGDIAQFNATYTAAQTVNITAATTVGEIDFGNASTGFSVTVALTGSGTLTINGTTSSGAITGATNASPIVITTASTAGLTSDQAVTIAGVGGNTNANGTYYAQVLTGTTFALYKDAAFTTPVAGNAAYTSGGTWTTANINILAANTVANKISAAFTAASALSIIDGGTGTQTLSGKITANSVMTVTGNAGTLTISGAITANNGLTATDNAGTLTISGAITANNGLTATDNATLTLSGAVSATGGMTVNDTKGTLTLSGAVTTPNINATVSGTLVMNNNAAPPATITGGTITVNSGGVLSPGSSTTWNNGGTNLGTGTTITLNNGATLQCNNSTSPIGLGENIVLGSNAAVTITNAALLFTGQITLNGNNTITLKSTTQSALPYLTTINGTIIGAAASNTLTVAGTSTLALGSTTFSGSNPITITGTAMALAAYQANTITGATNATPIVITTPSTAALTSGQGVIISGVGGNTNANGTFFAKVLSATTFALYSDAALTMPVAGNAAYTNGGTWPSTTPATLTANVPTTINNALFDAITGATSPSGSITGATNASPIVITTASTTGLMNGSMVTISSVVGNTNANGTYFAKVLTATTFALYTDAALTTPVAGNAAYTSGGTWTTPSPIVITTASTAGLTSGQAVTIFGVGGNTNANGTYYAQVLTATTFALYSDAALTMPVASNAAYTSGGSWTTVPSAVTAVNITGSSTLTLGGASTYAGNTNLLGGLPVGTLKLAALNGSITGATNASPIVLTTASTTGLTNGSMVTISAVGGNTAANGTFFVSVLSATTFALYTNAGLTTPLAGNGAYTSGGAWTAADILPTTTTLTLGTSGLITLATSPSGSITGATNASPIVITTASTTGLTNGSMVAISAVGGNTNANGTFFVSVLSATTFSLYTDAALTTPVAGNAAYTSGGAWTAPSPIVITTANTASLTNGQAVAISGVGGNTAANGTFFAKVLTGTTFALYTDAALTTPVAGNGTYTSGGLWTNNNTATLDLGGVSQAVAGLAATGTTPASQVIGNSSTTAGSTLTVNGTSTFGGTIKDVLGTGTQTVGLTVGTGTLTLAGNDTYSGATTISATTTLQAGSTTAFSASSSVSDSGTLDLGGFSNSIAALNGAGAVINSGTAATLSVTGGGTFSGNITGANTALTVDGVTSQTLTLSGNNTYAGGTTINSGDTLKAGSSTALTGATSVSANGTLDLNGNSLSIGALNGAGTVINSGAAATLTVGGGSFNGNITGSTTALTVGGTSQTLTLSGNNTYAGGTTINSGDTLKAGSSTALTTGTNLTDSGTLDLGGNSISIGALTGAGGISNSGAAATLTVSGGGSLSGNITGATTALTVGGTSQTLTLSGNNTYGGGTTVNSGDTLKAGSSTALTSATSVSANGTLDLGGKSISIGALNGSGSVSDSGAAATLTVTGGGTFSGAISGANTALTVGGTSQTLTLSGTSTYGGATLISNTDTLLVNGSETSAVSVQSGATLGGIGSTGVVTVAGGTVNPGSPVSGTGTLLASSADFSSAGNLTVNLSGSLGALSTDLLQVAGALTLGGGSTLTIDLSGLTTTSGAAITVISDGSQTGQFSSFNVVNNPNGFQVFVGYTSNSVTVTVAPTVTASSLLLPANATSMTVSGTGFDTNPAHDSVTFDDGVTGTVTSATATSLTLSLNGVSNLTGGAALHASATVDGVGSGSPVQVAAIAPVVSSSSAGLPANSTAVTLNGFGFDSNPANDSVSFDNSVTGTITSATLTSLTVSLTGLSSLTSATTLHAGVTVNGTSSGSAVQVATIAPVVSSSSASLPANSTAVTLSGFGFDSNPANDSVSFDNGVTGSITAATLTSLTVSLSGLSSLTGGTALHGSVTVAGGSSSAVQVATIAPVVTPSGASLLASAGAVTLSGFGFDSNPANDSVSFDNGVTGTITSATLTSLTVSLNNLIGGTTLHASVIVDGSSSGSAVQVAAVVPVLSSSSAGLPANAASLTLSGFGFDPTATHDSVTFDNGVTGSVTSATLTSLTVSLSGLSSLTGGTTLHASVIVNGTSIGSAVQVATVAPVVSSSSSSLPANATALTLSGFGFDTTASNDSVSFDNGVTGTISAATLTSLTVSLSGLGSLTGGTVLHASVTVDGSSGSAVQVATVAPVVSSSSTSLPANATSLNLSGFGFDSTTAHDSVIFDNGVTGTVTSATLTSLTISLSGLSSLTGGTTLHATVTVGGTSNGSPVQVATVAPALSPSSAGLPANSATLTLAGFGFDSTTAHDSVIFDNGVTGTITSATLTSLTVSLSGLSSLTGGIALHASVSVNGTSSSAVQVATVAPVVSPSSAGLPGNATSLTLSGFGFDTTAGNDSVTFDNGVTGSVTSATFTSLTISLSGLSSLTGGTALHASVTVAGGSSGSAVQVATVAPAISSSTASLPGNAASLTISGVGFDTNTAHDSVTFDNGVSGTVTSASLNSLTVSINGGLTSLTAGTALHASITVNGSSGGSAVQVATVAPLVSASSASLPANASSLTLGGFGFDSTTAHDSVIFDNGVTGTITSATLTSLTVSLGGLSNLNGGTTLHASITVDGSSSGSAVQVATVAPVVSASSAGLPANSATLTLTGFGFDTSTANDSVTFDKGVTGTVTSASLNSMTVSLSGLGNLTTNTALHASVTVNGTSSGSPVLVAVIAPLVSSSSASLPANASSLTLSGFGFDTTAGNDSVTFDNGVTGSVTSATLTGLTVSLSGLSNLTGGTALHASVTVDGVSSGNPVQVATVAPVATPSSAKLPANAAALTLSGFGFDTTAANDSVTFDNGVTGTVTSATVTSLTVSLNGLSNLSGGTTLHASVTVDGTSNGSAVQVATVAAVLSSSSASLPANANSLTLSGFGFDSNTTHDSVSFDNGVTDTITSATLTSLTVSLTGLSSLTGGTTLHASVTINGSSSGSAVQVATVVPVVSASSTNLPANAASLTLSGFGFDSNTTHDSVSFDNGVTGTITSATLTSLTVSLSGLSSLTGGTALHASVAVNGTSSGSAVQVATVAPVVSPSSASLPATATSLTISGFGFDPNASHDSVSFDNGVAGTITSATLTSLTVSISSGLTSLTANTALHASVLVDGTSSGSPVQVATVAPVVSSSSASLPANAASITLTGYGFDTITAHDSVAFDNGVIGTVISASLNSLTVNLGGLASLTANTALHASVTVNGISSGSAVQVATVAPALSASSSSLPATATSLTLDGFGFDTTASNDSVSFDNGVTGTITSATLTSLTVSISGGLSNLSGGTALHASVTVDGVSSGSPVQVASVAPVVTPSSAGLPGNATSMTLSGFGFDPSSGNDSVTFDNGVTGTVTSASLNSLTVKLTGLSNLPSNTALHASVTVDAISSGNPVQVATVAPLVSPSTASLPANATSLTISGFGFDPNTSNDSVTFDNGVTGTVTSATLTSLTVSLTGLSSLIGGTALHASVTADGSSSGNPVQVATVAPVISFSSASLPANAASLTLSGFGFDSNTAHDSVSFDNGVTGTITSATLTSLTVSLNGLDNLTGGTALHASVTVNAIGSGSAVQAATVAPVVSPDTDSVPANAKSLTISGFGFDTSTAHDSVTFDNGVTGTVSSATLTNLTVSLTGLSNLSGGTALHASVTVNGSSSPPAQVASVAPVVTPSSASLPANASSLTINGFGFDTTAGNDSVTFDNGVTGTVSSATLTSLTVSLSGLGNLSFGTALHASVTVDGSSSGSPVEVAKLAPVLSSSTASLPANAPSLTLNGFGFDSTTANDSVTFDNGVTGTITNATLTSLTVSLSGLNILTGGTALHASVTVDGVSSGSPVQVASVAPVVTPSNTILPANSTSLTIAGFGFDTNTAGDSVTFDNGVTGTVTSATLTSLTVSLSGLNSLTGGRALHASVTVDGTSSGSPVQVAVVAPVVSPSSASLPANATSLTISGFSFDTNTANETVSFDNGVTGTITSASPFSLTVSVSGLSSLTANTALHASVMVDGVSSGSPVQVATIAPVVTPSSASLSATATSVTINGFGFDPNTANDNITFSGGVTGTITNATATQMIVSNLSGLTEGSLTASVTVNGLSSRAVQVATVVPFVAGVSSTAASGTYGPGALIPITVTYNQPVMVTGTPQLSLNDGGVAKYSSGSGTSTLTFAYVVAAGQSTSHLDEAAAGALSLNGGSIVDGFGDAVSVSLPVPGDLGSLGANTNLAIGATTPSITSVSSSAANGTYGLGALFSITVSFNEAVDVSGTPKLALNSGGTALYSSGSGSSVLTFRYTVAAGDATSALDYKSSTALSLNSGAITEHGVASVSAGLALPPLGGGSSLSPARTIVIDAGIPQISSVTTTAASGTYGVGAVFAITVAYNKVVDVTGTPALQLNSGGSANYTSGSGSTALVFTYTSAAGNSSTALDYSSTSALSLHGGTIKQRGLTAGTNNASLTLPPLKGGNSLAPGKRIVIDTSSPQVSRVTTTAASGTYGPGAVFAITVAYNKAVDVTGMPALQLNSGGSASYSSGSGGTALVFTYTVSGGNSTSALDYSSTSALGLNGGAITEHGLAAGSTSASLTLPPLKGGNSLAPGKRIVIDTSSPQVSRVTTTAASGTYGPGTVLAITVAYNKAVDVTGTPTLQLNSGGSASYSSGSGSTALVFAYTVSSGDSTAALDYSSANALSLNGGAITEHGLAPLSASQTLPPVGGGNSLFPGKTIVIGSGSPQVTSVTTTAASGTDGPGTVLAITVNYNRAVDVSGTPLLQLNSGGTATYSSGSGSTALVFRYTVGAGNSTTALDYSSTSALILNGGTIMQHGLMAGSANASQTLPAPGGGNSLSANKSIVIDTSNPQITGITTTAASGTYGPGAVLAITVAFNKAVDVTGTPTLRLNSGGSAGYTSGSGTPTLVFTYTVGAGESSTALDYSGASALSLNGGAIKQHGLAAGSASASVMLPPLGAGSSLFPGTNITIIPADHLAFVIAPAKIYAGSLSVAFTLQLQNAFNQPIFLKTGAQPFVVSLGTSSSSPPAQFYSATGNRAVIGTVTFNPGTSNASFLYFDSAVGTPTLTASGAALSVGLVESVVALQLAFIQQPASVAANAPITPIVEVLDQFGSVVTNAIVTLTLNGTPVPSGGAPLVLSGGLAFTDSNGLATFSSASINLAGTYTLTATVIVDGQTLTATSNRFTVTTPPSKRTTT